MSNVSGAPVAGGALHTTATPGGRGAAATSGARRGSGSGSGTSAASGAPHNTGTPGGAAGGTAGKSGPMRGAGSGASAASDAPHSTDAPGGRAAGGTAGEGDPIGVALAAVAGPAAATRPVRVMLADAAPMQRSGLRMALAAADGLAVVGEAGDGVDAVELARRLLPDVLVMDLALPKLDGLAATRAIVDARLPVRVLILTAHDSDEHVIGAISAGAAAFLRKDVPADELVAGIRAVSGGGAVIAPALLARLMTRFADALPAPETTATSALDTLTEREREVLVHVARGHSNAEIAHALMVSETTIKTHVGHVLTKLRLRDRVQAVVLAYESGLVRPGG